MLSAYIFRTITHSHSHFDGVFFSSRVTDVESVTHTPCVCLLYFLFEWMNCLWVRERERVCVCAFIKACFSLLSLIIKITPRALCLPEVKMKSVCKFQLTRYFNSAIKLNIHDFSYAPHRHTPFCVHGIYADCEQITSPWIRLTFTVYSGRSPTEIWCSTIWCGKRARFLPNLSCRWACDSVCLVAGGETLTLIKAYRRLFYLSHQMRFRTFFSHSCHVGLKRASIFRLKCATLAITR